MSSPENPFADQLAQAYLAQFEGIPETHTYNPDSGHFENAGITLAALAAQGDVERVDALVQDLSRNSEYQVMALAHSLQYVEATAAQPLLQALDAVEPGQLPVEVRTMAMAAIADARERIPAHIPPSIDKQHYLEHQTTTSVSAISGWSHYRVGSDEIFHEIASRPFIDDEAIAATFKIQPFTEFPDKAKYQQHMTEVAIDFARSSNAERQIATGFGFVSAGELVVMGTLQGAQTVGDESVLMRCADEFTRDPKYSGLVTSQLVELFRADNATAPLLYDRIQAHREHLTGTEELEVERAKFMARQGNTVEALAYAETVPNYIDRVWILLNAAKTLAAEGRTERARAVIADAIELDPLTIEPWVEEADTDAFEDMPKIDENDLRSISVFNEEAGIRATFIEKTRYDLLTDQGHTLESVADTAAKIGAFDLAAKAFGLSRKYPESDTRMAREAVAQQKTTEYLTALLDCEALDDIYKPSTLERALTEFIQRPSRFTATSDREAIDPTVLSRVAEYALTLTRQDQTPNDRYFTRCSANVLVALGNYDAARNLLASETNDGIRGELDVKIISHMAYSGRVNEALALYLTSAKRITNSMSRESALRAIAHNGMLLGDYDSARVALTEMPGYHVRTAVGSILLRESGVAAMPEWLAAYALGPETSDSAHDVKSIGQALLRAGVVKKQ